MWHFLSEKLVALFSLKIDCRMRGMSVPVCCAKILSTVQRNKLLVGIFIDVIKFLRCCLKRHLLESSWIQDHRSTRMKEKHLNV